MRNCVCPSEYELQEDPNTEGQHLGLRIILQFCSLLWSFFKQAKLFNDKKCSILKEDYEYADNYWNWLNWGWTRKLNYVRTRRGEKTEEEFQKAPEDPAERGCVSITASVSQP